MNRLIIILICFLSATSLVAQLTNTTPPAEIAAQDLKAMTTVMASKHPTLVYNQAQKQQLLAVLETRAKEVYKLRQQPSLTKLGYSVDYKKIAKKYEDKLLKIMSPSQKKVFLGKTTNSIIK